MHTTGHYAATSDSDYHSMISSQSNSTESLDALNKAGPFVSDRRLCFDRAISKPSPVIVASPSLLKRSPSFTNDYFNTVGPSVPTTTSSFVNLGSAEVRRFSVGSTYFSTTGPSSEIPSPFLSDDAKQSLYQRRDSFNGLTELANVKPKVGALYLRQAHCDYNSLLPITPQHNGENISTTPTTTTTTAISHQQSQSRTILRRAPLSPSAQLPNMSVPPPNHSSAAISLNYIPIFDATVPPPTFVPRSVRAAATIERKTSAASPSSVFVEETSSLSSSTAAAEAAATAQPKVELYRPREMRQTPQQNLQSARNPTKANAVVHPKPLHVTSKIAAKFNETPIIYVTAPHDSLAPKATILSTSPSSRDFPALGAAKSKSPVASNQTRYIVKKVDQATDATPAIVTSGSKSMLYRTPIVTQLGNAIVKPVATKSLASIVRTTLPKLMQQVNCANDLKTPTPPSNRVETQPTPAKKTTTTTTSTVVNDDDARLGMSNVNAWLKSLRLHKYQWLFAGMTYAKMMAIDDAFLERMQITKGARNKLALSVQRLHDRYEQLENVERDLQNGSALLVTALDELLAVAQTPMQPMQPFVVGDVATKLMKVLNLGEIFFLE